jgi:hypothetical protein
MTFCPSFSKRDTITFAGMLICCNYNTIGWANTSC